MSVAPVLLPGLALLLALSPAGCGGGNAGDPPKSGLERQAQRVEARLAGSPGDAKLTLKAMTAWIEAGNERLGAIDTTTTPIPGAVAADFRAGLRLWGPYLRQTEGEASADSAELAGSTYFGLLELGSRDLGEIESNAAEAARALRIAGRHRPDLFTLSNLAVYEYFNGEFAAGEKAAQAAAADVHAAERPGVTEALDEYRRRAETFRGQLRKAAAQLHEGDEEKLGEPLKAFASSTGLNKGDQSR